MTPSGPGALRVAVIGSNSFSGSHLVAELLAGGHSVLGISRSPEPAIPFLPYRWDALPGGFSFLQADINTSLDQIDAALRGFSPAIVVNLAAQSMVAQSWDRPEDWYRTNVVGLVGLVQRLRRLPGLARYVHVSTPEVYGDMPDWASESELFRPSTPYAVSRAAGDWHLLALHRTEGFPIVITRAANVYGPGQQLYRIVPRAVLAARFGRELPLQGGGRSVRSFIHVADVARATWTIATEGQVGTSYHVSTRDAISIRRLVEAVFEQCGTSPDPYVRIVDDRPGKDPAYRLDSSRLEALGWFPRVALQDGLREVIHWADRFGPILRALPVEYVHKP